MLKVAFIYAPFAHQSFEENLRVVDEDFGRLPPISLAYAAAIAEAAGHQVVLIDANALGLDLDQTISRLRSFGPDVLCFTLSTYMTEPTIGWMRALRRALGVPTVAGGINMRLYPEETLGRDGVDYGVLHFGLRGLPALLDAIEQGRSPVGLPEVAARDESGRVVLGPFDPRSNPYPALPEPARHLLDNSRYYSFISQRRNYTVMVTGTGCDFGCTYCAITTMPRFKNPLDRVVAEVAGCVERHGVHEIDFFDADFFSDGPRAEELCRRLIELDLDLEWSCRSRIDALDLPMLRLAHRAGCRKVYVGLETPSADALKAMGKRIDLSRVRERLLDMRRLGIRSLGFFMIGVTGETHRSAIATVVEALRLPLDYAQFSRMIAKPGSCLHERMRRSGSDYWRDVVLGRPVPARVPYSEAAISEEAIELYTKLGYVAFYYRPTYVLRTLRAMRSLDEVRRSARTALRMVAGLRTRDTRET